MIVIRPYEARRDEPRVYALWQTTLGSLWPVSYETFHAVTTANPVYQAGDHFVAVSGDEIVGWAATQMRPGMPTPSGHLVALLVDPMYRRRGVGRMLHDHALGSLSQRGAARIQLGGGYIYFWQGVPLNLPGAWSFFQACGWQEVERSFDLVADIGKYVTPVWVYQRLPQTISIAQATAADAEAILAFEEQHFPGWFPYYKAVLNQKRFADVVIATKKGQEIAGAACVEDPEADPSAIRWETLLGESTGGIGILGVAEAKRGHGIGLALAARVTEILRDRALARSYIGWTWLVDWYGKLGYKVWQEYIMSWRTDR